MKDSPKETLLYVKRGETLLYVKRGLLHVKRGLLHVKRDLVPAFRPHDERCSLARLDVESAMSSFPAMHNAATLEVGVCVDVFAVLRGTKHAAEDQVRASEG